MTVFPVSGWADLRKFGVDVTPGYSIVDCEKGLERLYFVRERMDASSKFILNRLLAEPEWAEKLSSGLASLNQQLFDFDESLRGRDFSKMSDAELSENYAKHLLLQKESHWLGMVWNTLEFDKPLFTNCLTGYLEKLAGDKGKAAEAFSLLTSPLRPSFAQKEERSMLALATAVQANEKAMQLFKELPALRAVEQLASASPELAAAFNRHYEQFCWLPYMYEGPAWGHDYFAEVLGGLVKQSDCRPLLEKEDADLHELGQRQERLAADLGIDERHERLFGIGRDIVFTKGFRKDGIYHGFYCIDPLLKEAAKRMGISLGQLRRLTPYELVDAIRARKADANVLNERFGYSLYYTDALKPAVRVLSGKAARDFMAGLDWEEVKHDAAASELKGYCACPGTARGVVKLVERAGQMEKMPQGDILVAHSTNPDIVPAMTKAAAIVTDLGGITCHAAIISRELGIPCVIGTKSATKVLHDGDVVEVDATNGVVRRIGG